MERQTPSEILKSYRRYASSLRSNSLKNFNKFLAWLQRYIQLKQSEYTFRPSYLPRYEEGQIIFVDFGCGIDHEFSYPHYAIVLDTHDMKKSQFLTVVPMTSKKPKHKHPKPWEHELQAPIPKLLAMKVLNNFDLQMPEYTALRQDIVSLMTNKITDNEFHIKYEVILNKGLQSLLENNKAIMQLREKMKDGSIVETNQLRTLSKARINFPRRKTHPLYGIKISKADLNTVKVKIAKNIIVDTIDRTEQERI